MLQSLIIKNFALIENQSIEFKKGFNVLVGETGAGKSLILDALKFVLGDKSNKLNLRNGKDKMFVQAVFDDNSDLINSFLSDNGVESDDNLIFSRTFSVDGKTECRINGVVVPTSVVKGLSNILLDICSQNENIELLKPKNHLAILDVYAGDSLDNLKNDISVKLNELNILKGQMSSIGGDKANRERELELLEYQIKDIENANLNIGEDDELKEKIYKLSNYEKIFDNLRDANNKLNIINEHIANVQCSLEDANKYDSNLSSLYDRVASSRIELEDINESIVDLISSTDFDVSEIEKLDARYEQIKLLKKKYGGTIEGILSYLDKIKIEYDNLLFGEEKLNKLQKQYNELRSEIYTKSCELSNARVKVAKSIESNVTKELELLGFKNAKFSVHFDTLPSVENASFSKSGLDNIEFLLSANLGQELKSLSKTISGGEMSRFMLALKNVFAKCFNTSTLVFDEIDSGISGEIGQRVAERLAVLSKYSQLICITHLCQVTAMADNYIFVKKYVENNETYTKISYLNDEDIIKYIAIVSGAQPTDVALQFAKELKNKAEHFKQSI